MSNLSDFMMGQLEDDQKVQGILKQHALRKKMAPRDMLLAKYDDKVEMNKRKDAAMSRRDKMQRDAQKRQQDQQKQQQQQQEAAATEQAQADAMARLEAPPRIGGGADILAQNASGAAGAIQGQVNGGRGVQSKGQNSEGGTYLNPEQLAGNAELPPSLAPPVQQGRPANPDPRVGTTLVSPEQTRREQFRVRGGGRGGAAINLLFGVTGLDDFFGRDAVVSPEQRVPDNYTMERLVDAEVADKEHLMDKSIGKKERDVVAHRLIRRRIDRQDILSAQQNDKFQAFVDARTGLNANDRRKELKNVVLSMAMGQAQEDITVQGLHAVMQDVQNDNFQAALEKLKPFAEVRAARTRKMQEDQAQLLSLQLTGEEAAQKRQKDIDRRSNASHIANMTLLEIQTENEKFKQERHPIDAANADLLFEQEDRRIKLETDAAEFNLKTAISKNDIQSLAAAWYDTDKNYVKAANIPMLSRNTKIDQDKLSAEVMAYYDDGYIGPSEAISLPFRLGQFQSQTGFVLIPDPGKASWYDMTMGGYGVVTEHDAKKWIETVHKTPVFKDDHLTNGQLEALVGLESMGFRYRVERNSDGNVTGVDWPGASAGQSTAQVPLDLMVDFGSLIKPNLERMIIHYRKQGAPLASALSRSFVPNQHNSNVKIPEAASFTAHSPYGEETIKQGKGWLDMSPKEALAEFLTEPSRFQQGGAAKRKGDEFTAKGFAREWMGGEFEKKRQIVDPLIDMLGGTVPIVKDLISGGVEGSVKQIKRKR